MKARFFRSDAMVERFGEQEDLIVESEWFQLTYNELRTAPDGDPLATYWNDDLWYVLESDTPFSDVVIFSD